MSFRIKGSPSKIVSARVSVGSTATLVAAAREGRSELFIRPGIGTRFGDSSVTFSTGFELETLTNVARLKTAAAVYAIRDSGTSNVSVLELYDEEG